MTVSELCGKFTELCHQGKALDEVFIMVDTMATDVDDEGLLTYRNEVAFNPMTLCVEPGRIYVRESPFLILEGECMSEAEYDNPCAFCGFASERTDSMGHDYLVCDCDNPDDYPNEAVCNNEADKES